MKIAFFSTQPYDVTFFDKENKQFGFELEYFETGLDEQTVNVITENTDVVCVFVNDKVDAEVISNLAKKDVKYIALRCAGFNNVDLDAAHQHNIRVCRVPAYSPEAVAEHTLAMLFTINRKIHKAYNRVREQNFSLNGLLGTNIYKKTVGIIGTGNIGAVFCRMMKALGTEVLAYDIYKNEQLEAEGIRYVELEELFTKSDIISLHCPLTPDTMHLINEDTISKMKDGVMLINTSRGKLIDTHAIIQGLRAKKIGALGIDVYEQEEKVFFRDLSGTILEDERLQLLTSFPNVLVTAHQAFFTDEALTQIAFITLDNLKQLKTNNEIVGRNAEL
ncbi:2-hydroxyacid dehydrogenase [Myroides odoratimimus]|uniref:2-hydroxyacid dehydrogenase n=1 Tax=Myroides odoratimimus TaxID=76832 RepID=UPI0010407B3B|nr:2-hydroxyacid dehydrogenase [Myroides odoratimimus]MCA4792509.1 2-hydroxyacid dehydrogenase [Myroides odoratimimus]MCA4805292.1 2-hydroxyacid dehydrogenase [Myroides odoratimimus]MCA4819771.1 2-hydroxyacid dehydrogenase [Myroides odoratimimus]MDM1058899.1 2-hydroxyacid dehydrogenase [Myroides odoratimimus]MDM1065147.1 2-hydroxyacid dehydrogenase [Myroides odoratimimus]